MDLYLQKKIYVKVAACLACVFLMVYGNTIIDDFREVDKKSPLLNTDFIRAKNDSVNAQFAKALELFE